MICVAYFIHTDILDLCDLIYFIHTVQDFYLAIYLDFYTLTPRTCVT